MADYKFKADRVNKVLEVTVSGKFSHEEGMSFSTKYAEEVAKINASDYVLNVICYDLTIAGSDTVGNLDKCIETYAASGFKKVVYTITGDPGNSQLMVKMQVNRLSKKHLAGNYEIEMK